MYVLQAFALHAVIDGGLLATAGGGCSGQLLVPTVRDASIFKGEVTKYYLWVFEQMLVGHEARGCIGKLEIARFTGKDLESTPQM